MPALADSSPSGGRLPSSRVLTAATADHFNSVQCLLHTLARTDPSVPVRVYALDKHVARRPAPAPPRVKT